MSTIKDRAVNNKPWTVYKHTTPSGYVYIGITCQRLSQRWNRGHRYNHNPILYASVKKYGWDKIKHEILFENLTEEEAKSKEKELILYYRSQGTCCNLTDGGDGQSRQMPLEQRSRISRTLTGKYKWIWMTDGESSYKIHPEDKPLWESLGFHRGRAWSPSQEARRKQSERSKNLILSKESRAKLSKSLTGQIYITDETVTKRIDPEHLAEYIGRGWRRGRVPKKHS